MTPLTELADEAQSPAAQTECHFFTKQEYRELHRLGLFGSLKTELVNGQIYDMAPQNDRHALAISRLNVAFIRQMNIDSFWLRSQATIETTKSLPEPDVAIIRGKDEQLVDLDKSVVLVIEVADTSLRKDLGEKAITYAVESYPEYWVFDVNAAVLHVFKEPLGAGTARRYSTHSVMRAKEVVKPLFDSQILIQVDYVLPLGSQHAR